jgi:hypothetical protein
MFSDDLKKKTQEFDKQKEERLKQIQEIRKYAETEGADIVFEDIKKTLLKNYVPGSAGIRYDFYSINPPIGGIFVKTIFFDSEHQGDVCFSYARLVQLFNELSREVGLKYKLVNMWFGQWELRIRVYNLTKTLKK